MEFKQLVEQQEKVDLGRIQNLKEKELYKNKT